MRKIVSSQPHCAPESYPDPERSAYSGPGNLPPPYPPPDPPLDGVTASPDDAMDVDDEQQTESPGAHDAVLGDVSVVACADEGMVVEHNSCGEQAAGGTTPAGEQPDDIPEDGEHSAEDLAGIFLLEHSFVVEPTYRRLICIECRVFLHAEYAHGHRTSKHRKQGLKLPEADEFKHAVQTLKGDEPLPFPRHPIPAIPFVTIFRQGYRCVTSGCTENWRVFPGPDTRAVRKHLADHKETPDEERLTKGGQVYQQVVGFRGHGTEYFAVQSEEEASQDATYESIAMQAENNGYGARDPYFRDVEDTRLVDDALSRTSWLKQVKDVDKILLRRTVYMPHEEPELDVLMKSVVTYYTAISNQVNRLSVIVLRYIASDSPRSDPSVLFPSTSSMSTQGSGRSSFPSESTRLHTESVCYPHG